MLMAQAAIASHFLSDPALNRRGAARGQLAALRNIANRLRDSKYVTAQLLTYTGSGRFVCCGAHEWPVVYRAKTKRCEVIEAPGPWLGIVADLPEIPVTVVTSNGRRAVSVLRRRNRSPERRQRAIRRAAYGRRIERALGEASARRRDTRRVRRGRELLRSS